MKVNESGTDRIIRAIVGVALLALFFTGVVSGGWGTAVVVVGALLLLTGAVGFCPLYALLKIKTSRSK